MPADATDEFFRGELLLESMKACFQREDGRSVGDRSPFVVQ